jgi:hypothetical protein
MEFHPEEDLDILSGNEEFMVKAKMKLAQAMDLEIEENIRVFKSTFKK